MDYATIVNGQVTAITLGAGALPASTTTTLYFDITTYSPQPAVNDYFDELCLVFSATPFPIPPGSVAPPYQPGTTPPAPGSVTPTNPGPVPTPYMLPREIVFHAAGSANPLVLTAIPAARTALPAQLVVAADLTDACSGIVAVNLAVAASIDCQIVIEYSDDGGLNWYPLDGTYEPDVSLNFTGPGIGEMANISQLAWGGTVLLRPCTINGDGVTGAEIASLRLLAYHKTDPLARCATIAAPGGGGACGIPGGYTREEDFSSWADYADFYNARGDDNDGTGLFAIWYGSSPAPSSASYFDDARLFNGTRCLAAFFSWNGVSGNFGAGWWCDYQDGGGNYATLDGVEEWWVLEIEGGFYINEAVETAGLQLIDIYGNSFEPWFEIRLGKLYLWLNDGLGTGSIDLGTLAALGLEDTITQLVIRVTRTDLKTHRVQVFADPGCTGTPTTVLHDDYHDSFGPVGGFQASDKLNPYYTPANGPGAGGLHIWTWQTAYKAVASAYTPPSTPPEAFGTQGDDFAGGYPEFPLYTDAAHFNANALLRKLWTAVGTRSPQPFVPFNTHHAWWITNVTSTWSDNAPTESNVTQTNYWMRLRCYLQVATSGTRIVRVMAGRVSSNTHFGVRIDNTDLRLYSQIAGVETSSSIGLASLIANTAGFVDLVLHFEPDPGVPGNELMSFYAAAAGSTPVLQGTRSYVNASAHVGGYWVTGTTAGGSNPLLVTPYLGALSMVPNSVDSNPFGV